MNEYEILKCKDDFVYWLTEYARIIEPPTKTNLGGVIPFANWPNVIESIKAFENERMVVIMKSRQIGESYIVAAWCLWNALFKDGDTSLLFSRGEVEAIELLSKCRRMYDQLPGWMRLKLNPDSKTELGFPDRHSTIKAFAATEAAGVSFTASRIVCDEWEYHPFAESNYINAKPTIDAGGQFIGIFTVDKTRPVTLAKSIFAGSPNNGFKALFFPYNVRPNRGDEWYEATKASIPAEELQGLTPELYMEQNYPRCLSPKTLVGTLEGIMPIGSAPDNSRSGTANLYRLTTEQGRILEATKEHRIMTPGGYKEMRELNRGDVLLLKQPIWGYDGSISLPSHFKGEWRTVGIDEQWARFLGVFAGDGSISGFYDTVREAKQGISVVVDSQDADFLKLVEDDFDDLFGAHNTRKFRKANCMEVRVSRHWLVELFKEIGMVKPSGKKEQAIRRVCVPPCILAGSKENARAFLQGVFETDGSVCVDQRRSRILLAAKDGDFLRQVQFLLLGFGITSRVAPGKVTATVRGKKEAYGTNTLTLRKPEIELFESEIGFLSERKKAECHKICGLPHNGFNHAKPVTLEDVVASVEDTGIQSDVYDLVDQPDQCFSANGIWVHNSVEEALRATQTVAAVDLKVWDEMRKRCTAPVSVEGLDPLICKVWQPYQIGQLYVAASDTSHGVGKDYNVTVVMNVRTGVVVGHVFNNTMKPDEFAYYSVQLLKAFRNPKWFIEDNDWGATTIDNAKKLNYPNFGYQDTARTKIGWHTGASNRTLLFANLVTAFNTWGIQILDFEGLSQFGYLIRNMEKDGRIEAMKGKCDDYPTAVAICVAKSPEVLKSVSGSSAPIKTLTFAGARV